MFSIKLARFGPVKALRVFSRSIQSESDLVQVEEADGVRRIVMIDEKTRNSLSLGMVAALNRHLSMGINETSLRCIVISSSSPVFSAGHNLKEISDSEGRQVFYKFGELMMKMVRCPVPVITAVDGLAAAAGCQLVAQSDIAVASCKAKFCTPGAKVGVFCSTPGIPLVRAVPRKLASYMLFTGRIINADQAWKAGLVSVVTKEGELEKELEDVITDIKCLSRVVVENGKSFFYKQMEMGLSQAYEEGAETMDHVMKYSDGIEGLKSFTEKRKPVWKHIRYA